MLMISISSYYNSNNELKIKEIYVSDDEVLYIMKSSESFTPYEYQGNVKLLFDSIKNSVYPTFCMSDIHVYDDDDPKTLAFFLFKKIQSFDLTKKGSHETLINVLSSFGVKVADENE